MNCPKCNSPLPEGVSFCPECGTKIQVQQQNQNNGYTYQNSGGYQAQPEYSPNQIPQYNNYNTYNQTLAENDKPSIGLNILSFIFPLIGIIMYFACKKEKPVRSKDNLKAALIGFIVKFVLSIIITMAMIGGVFKLAMSTPGAHVTINGKEYVIADNGEKVPMDDYNEDKSFYEFNGSDSYENCFDDKPLDIDINGDGGHVFTFHGYDNVLYNGKIIKLPMSYSDFVLMTNTFFDDSSYRDTELEPGSSLTVNVGNDNNDFGSIILVIENNSDKTEKVSNCDIVEILDSASFNDE